MQNKYWCFTLNNPTDEDVNWFRTVRELPNGVTYLVGGLERGEQNGTLHVQGYAEFKTKRRWGGIRQLLPVLQRARFEVAGGTWEENLNYCTKGDDVLCVIGRGVNPGRKGGRSDLAAAVGTFQDTRSLKRVAEDHPEQFVKFHRGFEALERALHGPGERRLDLRVCLYVGFTGCGKTRAVHDAEAPDNLFVYPGLNWYDGYTGQEAALFDDYAGDIPIEQFLRVLDVYPMLVRVKGGFVWWEPRRIYITSNLSLTEWYPKAKECQLQALARRIHMERTNWGDEILMENNAANQ